jgi:hypothetical protein
MKRKILFFIVLILLPMASAVKLGVSNSKLDFNMSVNEESCRRIVIGTDYIGPIAVELKFVKNNLGDNKIPDYKLNPDYFEMNSIYEKEIIFEKPGNKETNICLIGKNPGNYQALMIYKTKNNNAAIGIIVNVYIKDERYNKTKIGLLLTPSVLLSTLLLLIILRYKSSKNNIE